MDETQYREALTSVDAAWRHMEDPTNLMMVSGIMRLEEKLEKDKLIQVFKHGWLIYDRMKQHIEDTPLIKTPHWVEDKPFHLENHMIWEKLSDPNDKQALHARMNELVSTPLDFNQALWQCHIFEEYKGGSVLLLRIHHCIADGIALIGVLLSLTGSSVEESLNLHIEPRKEKHYPHLSTIGYMYRQAGSAIDTARKTTTRLFHTTLNTVAHPSRLVGLLKAGSEGGLSIARLIFKNNDPKTIFKGRLGKEKVLAWSDAIPLADVKRIRRKTGSTVNDVLLTALSGALNRYLREKGEVTEGLEITAAVPVNLRKQEHSGQLGNQFGLVFLTLPVGIDEPLDRLFELKKRMDHLKNSPEAIVALGMLKTLGLAPAELQKTVVNILSQKITSVMTNVPGPREKFYLAGVKVKDMMFWVPCSGKAALGISILSYGGDVRLGLATDRNLVPDPQQIIQGFYEEFQYFMDLIRQVEEE
ncbi:MAG: wax ester/triacylglycerol synthase family O-acyltransferase [Acidobacteria bacterium]|nr:MAG: wax ester/triacylglycerol synthase family O-acyltransferase [Acidobacteriota bacterium]